MEGISKILLLSAMFHRSSNVLSDQINCTYKERPGTLNLHFKFWINTFVNWVSLTSNLNVIFLLMEFPFFNLNLNSIFCCSSFLFDPGIWVMRCEAWDPLGLAHQSGATAWYNLAFPDFYQGQVLFNSKSTT